MFSGLLIGVDRFPSIPSSSELVSLQSFLSLSSELSTRSGPPSVSPGFLWFSLLLCYFCCPAIYSLLGCFHCLFAVLLLLLLQESFNFFSAIFKSYVFSLSTVVSSPCFFWRVWLGMLSRFLKRGESLLFSSLLFFHSISLLQCSRYLSGFSLVGDPL